MEDKLKVLFLCTGNSCRSQMAEGWTRHLRSERIEPRSAGVDPGELDIFAVAVMAEAGVDISGHRPKPLSDVMNLPFDLVVTVCSEAHESCPVFPGAAPVVHRGFDDPPRLAAAAPSEEEALGHYRRVRDEIRAFVETLPGNLVNPDDNKSATRGFPRNEG
jgi:arsenate reductase